MVRKNARNRRLALLILALLLGSCGNDDDNAGRIVAAKKVEDLPQWLTPTEPMEPALWLRSREVGHEVLASDPEVDRLRRALRQAGARFYEDTRMIANRTAQAHDMMAARAQPELSVDIMTGLIDVADMTPGRKLYGEMCQHYLNLRRQGLLRSDALRQLMTPKTGDRSR